MSLPSPQVLYRLDERPLSLLIVHTKSFQWLASVLECKNWIQRPCQGFCGHVCRAGLPCEHLALVLLHMGLSVWSESTVAGWKTHHSEVRQLWIPHQWHHCHHLRTGTVLHVHIFPSLLMLNSLMKLLNSPVSRNRTHTVGDLMQNSLSSVCCLMCTCGTTLFHARRS